MDQNIDDVYRITLADPSLLIVKGREIDDLLEESNKQLEACVGNLEQMVVELAGRGSSIGDCTTTEAVFDHMHNFHTLEKTSCFDLSTYSLQQLFQSMSDRMKKQPGCEEAVFQSLLRFSEHTGLSLPFRSALSLDTGTGSLMSLNVVSDDSEQVCEAMWEELSQTFQTHYFNRLYQLPMDDDSMTSRQRRADCIEKLSLLLPTKQLWNQYRSLRVCGLNQLINEHLSSSAAASDDRHIFNRVVDEFKKISLTVIKMIDCDFHLLLSGVFRKVATTFEAISAIYFDKLVDELESIFDDLDLDVHQESSDTKDHLTDRMKGKLFRSSSTRGVEAGLLKSTEDIHHSMRPLLGENVVQSTLDLARSLMAVEEHVHGLYLMSYTGLRGTSARSNYNKDTIRGVLKATSLTDVSVLSSSIDSTISDLQGMLSSSVHTAEPKAPQVIEKPMHYDKPVFLWPEALKRLVPDLVQYIEYQIFTAAETCLSHIDAAKQCELVSLCHAQRGSKLEYPSAVWKPISEFVLCLDSLFPLAEAKNSILTPIRSSFIETSVAQLKKILEAIQLRVQTRVEDSDSHKCLLEALSSTALLRNTLYHCDNLMNKGGDRHAPGHTSFLLVYHQFCQAVESFTQQYIELEVTFVTTCLLHDADSNNWSDNKEFYEGERCSFAVQSWSYHMQTIWSQLWEICPPANSATIFGDILYQTLDQLTLRYMSVCPSYRRTEQFRIDVTTILLVVYELLFPVCSTTSQLLDIEATALQQPHLAIHSCCCKLVQALTIVCCPLDDLYKAFRRGIHRRNKRSRRRMPESSEDMPGYYGQWMHFIQPNIVPEHSLGYDDMRTTSALHLHLKLMLAQPEPQWNRLVQALLMKDLTLPIMLLTQEVHSPQDTGVQQCLKNDCGLMFCSGLCSLESGDQANPFIPFLSVLNLCHLPMSLYNVLFPVIERRAQWSFFDPATFYSNALESPPDWFTAVLELMKPSCTLMLQVIIMEITNSLDCVYDSVLELTELPCGCDIPPVEPRVPLTDSFTDLIKLVFKSLRDKIITLPPAVCVLFGKLQEHLNDTDEAYEGSVILQFVGYALAQCMRDNSVIETSVGGGVDSKITSLLVEVAPYLLELTGQKLKRSQSEKESVFIRENQDWLNQMKTEIIQDIVSREQLWPEIEVDDCLSEEFLEHSTTAIANDILSTAKGKVWLQQIYNTIGNNQSWIYSSLDISPTLPWIHPPAQEYSAKMSNLESTDANPVIIHRTIGSCLLDQTAIHSFPYDWAKLLQLDLGLTDITLINLMAHRHEFQDGAYLEENEKKPVEVLKTKVLAN